MNQGRISKIFCHAILAAFICIAPIAAKSQSTSTTKSSSSDRIESILGKMSLEEKIDYIGGTGFAVRAVPGLHLPALEMSDGPIGVRSNAGFPSTVYAAGIGLAATWDRDLAERVGEGIGTDARARGINFMLGPGVNIYRSPRNGRNFEYFGEDPFLASATAVGYISGMQKEGVSATIKHFLANNSEFLRHDSDSVVDERTLREIYLPAFEAAVKQAHVGAIMDSYNFINGAHATQNGYFNTDIVRKQWGFDGVVMSDWVATYDGVAAANGGLDLEMPTAAFMNRQNLLPAVQDGRVKQEVIDEKVRHILQTAIRFGWLDREQTDLNLSKYSGPNHEVALDAARESIVLLKNEGQLLPLDKHKIKSILVVGPDAYPAQPVGGGSGAAIPYSAVSILEGLGQALGNSVVVQYEPGLRSLRELVSATNFRTEAEGGEDGLKMEKFDNADLSGPPQSVEVVRHINNAGFSWDSLSDFDEIMAMMAKAPKSGSRRWTGYYIAKEAGPYEIELQGPGENNGFRLSIDGKPLFDSWELSKAYQEHATIDLAAGPHKILVEDVQRSPFGGRLRLAIADQRQLVTDPAKKLAAKTDVVVVAAGFNRDNEGEGADRTFSLPIGQDALIREMTAQNKNVIVAVTSGGAVDASQWINQVQACLELWYPGERGGTALAEILFGDVDPSGRLPITFEKRAEDNPTFSNYYPEAGSKRVVYKEGIFVGYRGYEHNHTEPLFPFGFGLSYTTFKLGNLSVKDESAAASGLKYAVSFDITNNGKRAGAEVAQVYISDTGNTVPRAPKELKGFVKVSLQPGETRHVTVPLDTRSFSYFNTNGEIWTAPAGTYKVLVGESSAQIELTSEIKLARTVTEKP
jgi:beta-glucosidase